MHVIRPVRMEDLDRLLELAELTSFGLTTLPKDRGLLEKRVKASVRGFQHLDDDEPTGQTYLFVIEETEQRQVVGTAGIVSKVGGFEPFYSYRIETSIHESPTLGVRKEIPVLHLVEEHDGPCEIGSLFLHPGHRHGGNGRVLSLSRFLFLAEFPRLFDAHVIAEMRGVIDDRGQSPFWDGVGKHFFDLDFPKADYLSIVNKEFIGDLMPRYPIYIPLLPAEAQAVIGEVHELTRPARKLLESEGFLFHEHVDIFEAGPMLHCLRNEIRSVRESLTATVAAVADTLSGETEFLIANRQQEYRACRGVVQETREGVELTGEVAEALQVGIGDPVRYVPLRPGGG
jgi:arginine N-succinyltransferase